MDERWTSIWQRTGIRRLRRAGSPEGFETLSQIPIEGVVFGLSILSIVALIVAPHQIGAL